MAVDLAKVEAATRLLLEAIGENPERADLVETPARVSRFWQEFLARRAGHSTTFAHQHTGDQLVVVSGMRTWSMCEHHLLPFWCEVAIGYVPGARLLGLSKFARIMHECAGQLQVQERLVANIAETVQCRSGATDVAVLARGEHLCMTMRGVQTPALMTSSCLRGAFYEGPLRAEFLALATQAVTR